MRIIYVTTYCGKDLFSHLQEISNNRLFSTTQVFNGLFIEGLRDNHIDVEALTYLPISAYPKTRMLIIRPSRFEESGIQLLPILNIQFLKQISIVLSLFFYLPCRILRKNNLRDTVIVCDYLYLPTNIPILVVGALFGVRTVVVVPDIPSLIMEYVGVDKRIPSGIQRAYHTISRFFRGMFSGYILFSRNMAEKLSLQGKPWIEIEGIYKTETRVSPGSSKKNAMLYAGGLYEEYGIREMLDSLEFVSDIKMEAWICGFGTMAEEIAERAAKNPRIKYFGVVSHSRSIELQRQVRFVINPRPATGEFTRYSFPSKTFEYLTSGARVIMARLPGVPAEYFEYITAFDECTPASIAAAINCAAALSAVDSTEIAHRAFDFIHSRKNPAVQGRRIATFLNSLK